MVLGLAPVIDAADGDSGRRHSLLPRPTAGSVSPIISTQGVIVSGSATQRPQAVDSTARPPAPSPSASTTPSPPRRLTKRPAVAVISPSPSRPTTQSLVTQPKTAALSDALAIGTSTGSQALSQGTAGKPLSTFQGLASTTGSSTTATTRPSSALLASPSTLNSNTSASTSSGTATTSRITGSRSAANLLQNQAITSLLQPPAVTSPSPSPPSAPPPSTPPPSSPPPPSSSITGSAILSWNSNGGPDLAGYKVYVGTQSGLYTFPGSPFTIGTVTSYTVTNLPFGQTYFFAVSAYNNAGNESHLSNEVSKSIY